VLNADRAEFDLNAVVFDAKEARRARCKRSDIDAAAVRISGTPPWAGCTSGLFSNLYPQDVPEPPRPPFQAFPSQADEF
jgi:hypothetical protein